MEQTASRLAASGPVVYEAPYEVASSVSYASVKYPEAKTVAEGQDFSIVLVGLFARMMGNSQLSMNGLIDKMEFDQSKIEVLRRQKDAFQTLQRQIKDPKDDGKTDLSIMAFINEGPGKVINGIEDGQAVALTKEGLESSTTAAAKAGITYKFGYMDAGITNGLPTLSLTGQGKLVYEATIKNVSPSQLNTYYEKCVKSLEDDITALNTVASQDSLRLQQTKGKFEESASTASKLIESWVNLNKEVARNM